MVVCLEQGADLHTAQLTPLPLTVSCSSKIQIRFTFLVLAHLGSPGKRAVKRECVCVCVISIHYAFSALTLLAGCQEEHPACKNWVMRCWCGYLSGSRCRLFAYGPADLFLSCISEIQTGFTFLLPGTLVVLVNRPFNSCSQPYDSWCKMVLLYNYSFVAYLQDWQTTWIHLNHKTLCIYNKVRHLYDIL